MPCEEKQWSSYKMDSAVITDLEAQPSDETDASAANLHGTASTKHHKSSNLGGPLSDQGRGFVFGAVILSVCEFIISACLIVNGILLTLWRDIYIASFRVVCLVCGSVGCTFAVCSWFVKWLPLYVYAVLQSIGAVFFLVVGIIMTTQGDIVGLLILGWFGFGFFLSGLVLALIFACACSAVRS